MVNEYAPCTGILTQEEQDVFVLLAFVALPKQISKVSLASCIAPFHISFLYTLERVYTFFLYVCKHSSPPFPTQKEATYILLQLNNFWYIFYGIAKYSKIHNKCIA